MAILSIGEVNVDMIIHNESLHMQHWNTVNAEKRPGGMCWNVAFTLSQLGSDVLLYAPHGKEFASVAKANNVCFLPVLVNGDIVKDNYCLELVAANGERQTVYIPFQNQSIFFESFSEICKKIPVEQAVDWAFVGCTEETYIELGASNRPPETKMLLTLSHVVKYWSDSCIQKAISESDYIVLEMNEAEELRSRFDFFDYSARNGRPTIIITKGEDGVELLKFHNNGYDRIYDLVVPKRIKRDGNIVGAGDSFCGGFIHAIDHGYSEKRALEVGQIVAHNHLTKKNLSEMMI